MGKHLTFELRAKIAALQRTGLTQAAIAAQIGCHQSVISRELRRNRTDKGYCCQQAQRQATARRQAASEVPRKFHSSRSRSVSG